MAMSFKEIFLAYARASEERNIILRETNHLLRRLAYFEEIRFHDGQEVSSEKRKARNDEIAKAVRDGRMYDG